MMRRQNSSIHAARNAAVHTMGMGRGGAFLGLFIVLIWFAPTRLTASAVSSATAGQIRFWMRAATTGRALPADAHRAVLLATVTARRYRTVDWPIAVAAGGAIGAGIGAACCMTRPMQARSAARGDDTWW
jgi:hypothetical protein